MGAEYWSVSRPGGDRRAPGSGGCHAVGATGGGFGRGRCLDCCPGGLPSWPGRISRAWLRCPRTMYGPWGPGLQVTRSISTT